MKCPTITLRDLFWLVMVVGMGLGWWLDHDRIRHAVQHLQALPVKSAEAKLRAAQAELAQMVAINQRAVCVSADEMRRTELQLEVAKADLETARARQTYLPNPKP